jgi:hypothetical protein
MRCVIWRMILISLAVVGVSCSNDARRYTDKGMTETLEIEILPNTSKMFVYRIKMPDDQIPRQIRIAQSSREQVTQTGIEVSPRTYQHLFMNSDFIVKKLGYCREGFLEIDRRMSRYHLWMKGECKESATEEDRQKFGREKTFTADSWRK